MTASSFQRPPVEGSDPDPGGLVRLPLELIQPCPLQPRVNVSQDLVRRLAESMRSGRHQALIEVEPAPGQPGRYQIVCGEQRWRAAREAGLAEVLVRVHRPLGHLERLEKQIEENRLRSGLDPIEEAHAVLLHKTLSDVQVAERWLREAGVAFHPLAGRELAQREQIVEHLDHLKRLLMEAGIHVRQSGAGREVAPLSPWRVTERALGISETARKLKLGVLRLPAELHQQVRGLPAEVAVGLARLSDPARQAELLDRAPELSPRELRRALERLHADPELEVDQALRPLPRPTPVRGIDRELDRVIDLIPQLTRALGNLGPHLAPDQRQRLVAPLARLLDWFEAEG